MKLHKGIEPFRATIEALQRLLAKFDNRGVIIGGIAVGFLGRPRLTEDVDMKAIAHRPKDLEDIRTIVNKNPKLDISRIEQWVKQFAEVLEMPSLWGDIAEMFKE